LLLANCVVIVFADAFEFYMFHFAYFLVNTKAFKGVSTSRRVRLPDLWNICSLSLFTVWYIVAEFWQTLEL